MRNDMKNRYKICIKHGDFIHLQWTIVSLSVNN